MIMAGNSDYWRGVLSEPGFENSEGKVLVVLSCLYFYISKWMC